MDIQENPILVKAYAELVELEKQLAEKKQFINKLYVYLEQPPPFSDAEIEVTAVSNLNGLKPVKEDEYFGQPAATAVKAVLKRYREADRAPVELDEIISCLKEGGYKFNAEGDKNIRNSLTVMLSKNTEFVRVGNVGQKYGLREWYPNLVSRKKIAIRRNTSGTIIKPVNPSTEEQEAIEDVEPLEEEDQEQLA